MKKKVEIDARELEEAIENGRSYADIAQEYGVSRERIRQIATHTLTRVRRHGKIFEEIPYEGLYKLFQNEYLSVPKFTLMVFGNTARNQKAKMDHLLKGTNVQLSIKQIERICELCGMSFEDCFRRREVTQDAP